ncbi:tyrosine-type recombinase/integrase [Halomontanus rarus]|uniref:tyrosine-type recombinase/integrase n=1 Tax=Halomontanus rarus TaxID=3034020 RepID=UPI001A97D894
MAEKKHEVLLDADLWERRVFENEHEAVNEWLRSKNSTGKKRKTLNAYSRTAAVFFHEVIPDTAPDEVRVSDIEQWVQDLDARDCSANTKRRYVESLSSFYDWAMKRPHAYPDIRGNPAAVVLEELEKVRRERPETATWENGKQVIWQIPDPRDKAAAVMMAKTGARVGEVLSLKRENLMLEKGFVRFRDRKGGKSTVNPVDDETIDVLQRLLAMQNGDSEYVFVSYRGGRIGKERIRREVRNAAVEAGVMDDVAEKRWHYKFVPHYYRTIFTSLMRNSDPAMRDHWVAYLRGDSDQEIQDLYTKIPREKVRERYLEIMKPVNV